jgi:ABC-type transport system involved in multi-copper enzyme maturation permease subunit
MVDPVRQPNNKTIIGAMRSEAKRLKRWTFTGIGAGLIAFFTVMGTSIIFLADSQLGDGPQAPGLGAVVDLESPQGIVAGLTMAANLIGIVALSLWAAAAASDYTSGWIRVMVQAEPRRWRLLAGKFLALSGFTVVGTLIATIVGVALAPMLAAATDVSTELWSSGIVGTVASGWLNLTIAVLVWGVIGFAVATATRSAVVAISAGVGYLMVFEGLLGLAAEDATIYLPGSVLGEVVAGGGDAMAYGTSLALAAVYATIAAAIAIYVFHRRDVTS